LRKRQKDNLTKGKQIIKLNVGGKIFTTSKSTLLSIKDTYFYSLVSSGKWKPEEDGAFFIDRNPKHFDRILDFLRTGELDTRDINSYGMEKLKKDCEYFIIDLPQFKFVNQWDPNYCGNLNLSPDKQRITKSGNDGWNAAALGISLITSSYKVRIINRGGDGNIMIGLAPKSGFQPTGQNHDRCGWYIYAYNGTFYGQSNGGARDYGSAIQNGSEIEVLWNGSSISFSIGGKNLGVAFSGIPQQELFPAVNIYDSKASLQLIN